MKQLIILVAAINITLAAGAQENIRIIPKPVSLTVKKGVFEIDRFTTVKLSETTEMAAAANFFVRSLKEISGITPALNKPSKKLIEIKLDKKAVARPEGYKLSVSPQKILIEASDHRGVLYAFQTILQTLPAIRTNAPLQVPCMEITDYPRFSYRGMHLDVSRHFFSPATVKTYIDLIAKYKFNTFHWHLIDDQGWRLEIKKYPRLTTVGAWRVNRLHKPWESREIQQPGETADYGGYYTQEQVKEIVAYAAERGVTVIPEIEMPAHVESAIAAYPHLSCIQQPQTVLPGGIYPGNFQTSYCAGNEQVFSFLEDVLNETMQLFPSKYIHIGGDELDKRFWEKCSKCQKRMKDEGLKNVDELQSYFIHRMEKFLNKKGRKIIGWDEILEGGLAPDATVMSWRGEAGGIAAAKMNHDVIMTPGSPLYFDAYQAGPSGEPTAIGGFNTLKKVYQYDPIPKELNAVQAKYVLGAQANLWAEYITTPAQVFYMVLPRMAALAEVVWSPAEIKNFEDFRQRLQNQFVAYDQLGLNHSKGNYSVIIKPLIENGILKIALDSEMPGTEIHYTTNGSLPNAESAVYHTPFEINSSAKVQAITVENGKPMGLVPTAQDFVIHKATGAAVQYEFLPANQYMADGPNALTDGIRGTLAVGKFWHGFDGRDLIATIDLGEEKQIGKITLGCLQHYRDWIFLPTKIKFEISADGKNYTTMGEVINDISPNEMTPLIKDFSVSFEKTKAKFVKVSAAVLPQAPKGHSGEGKPVWLFADEIIVE